MKLGVKEYMDTYGRDLSTHAVFKANLAWEIQQAHSGKSQSKQSYLSVKGKWYFSPEKPVPSYNFTREKGRLKALVEIEAPFELLTNRPNRPIGHNLLYPSHIQNKFISLTSSFIQR